MLFIGFVSFSHHFVKHNVLQRIDKKHTFTGRLSISGLLTKATLLFSRSSACMQAERRVQQTLDRRRYTVHPTALPAAAVITVLLVPVALGWLAAVSERPLGLVTPAGYGPCTVGPAGEQLLGPCLTSPGGQRRGFVEPVGQTPCTVDPAGERLLGPCLMSPSGQRLAPPSPADTRSFTGFAFGPHAEQQPEAAAARRAAAPNGASGPAFGPCIEGPGSGAQRPRSVSSPRGALAYEPCLDLSPGASAAPARAVRKGPAGSRLSTAGRRGAPLVSVNGPLGPSMLSLARFAVLPRRAVPLPGSGRTGAGHTNVSAPVLPPIAYALSDAAGMRAVADAARDGTNPNALEALAAARAAACRHASGPLSAAACAHAAAQGAAGAGRRGFAGVASSALRRNAGRPGSRRGSRGAPTAVASASAAFLDEFGVALARSRCSAACLDRGSAVCTCVKPVRRMELGHVLLRCRSRDHGMDASKVVRPDGVAWVQMLL